MHRRSANEERQGKVLPSRKSGTRNKKKGKQVVFVFLIFSFGVAALILFLAISALRLPDQASSRFQPPLPIHGLKKRPKTTGLKNLPKPADEHLQKGNTVSDSKSNNNEVEYYMVFSTSCSAFQDWQSYVLFYTAMKVKQPGHVIRIASGCSEEKTELLKKIHEERVKTMSDNFHVHFTPDFAGKGKDAYKYNNKPFGLRHFLENFLGYPEKKDAENAVIIIVDPDQLLLKPITNDFSDTNVIWHLGPDENKGIKKPRTRVEHGSPIAQMYAFGDQPFRKVNITAVAGKDSPALGVSSKEASAYYPAGPPYLATTRDMYSIALHWTKFMPEIHRQYPELLGEMFGYCIASAHVGLPHQISESFMVSDPDMAKEGWGLFESLPVETLCKPNVVPVNDLPQVLHYCQRYWLGDWFIGKYRLDANFISCEAPLLTEPPMDVGVKYDYYIAPGGLPYGKKEKLPPAQVKRHTWTMCFLIRTLNEVAVYFKKNHCDETANFNMTYVFGPNRTEYSSEVTKY